MNAKGETYIKDENGNVQTVVTDEFGEQFVLNEKGEKKPLFPNAVESNKNF